MKVIMLKNHEDLKANTVATVADGFGQNFLISKGYAILANEGNLKKFNENKAQKEKDEAEAKALSLENSIQIKNLTLQFERKGNHMKMFGSITNEDVSKALMEHGIEIRKNKIKLNKIYGFGEFEAIVDCGNNISETLNMYVGIEE